MQCSVVHWQREEQCGAIKNSTFFFLISVTMAACGCAVFHPQNITTHMCVDTYTTTYMCVHTRICARARMYVHPIVYVLVVMCCQQYVAVC